MFAKIGLAVLSAWLLAVPGAHAQTSVRGEVHGSVKDETGAVIPGAKITLTNLATGVKRTATTEITEIYVFPLVDPGFYELTVEKEGFASALVRRFQVITQSPALVDVVLKVGTAEQRITVEAGGEVLNVREVTVGGLITTVKLEEVPLNEKQYVNLVRLETGVAPGTLNTGSSGGRDFGNGGYINGKRFFDNTVTVDGGAFWDPWAPLETISTLLAGPGVAEDAIQEVKILAGNPPPSMGFVYGGQVSVTTRSGGKELHGTVYHYLRNDVLDARSFFDAEKPPFKRNLFGFTLGGPLQREKMFFFGNYEGMRQRKREPRVPIVPTPLLLSNVPGGAANGFLREILEVAYPDPVAGSFGPNDLVAPLPTSADLGIDYDTFMVRIDHNVGQKDHFFYRYLFNRGFGALGSVFSTGVPTTDLGSQNRWQQPVFGWTRIISPRTINEFRFNYNRQFNNFPTRDTPDQLVQLGFDKSFTSPNAMPSIFTLGGGLAFVGSFPGAPQFRGINFFQYNDTLSLVRGNHEFKIGGDFQTQGVNDFFPQDIRPFYVFVGFGPPFDNSPNGLTTGRFASVVNVVPSDPPTLIRGMRRKQWAVFFQDIWKVRPNLTLDLGIRYEVAGRVSEVDDLMNNLFAVDAQGQILPEEPIIDISRTALGRVGDCGGCFPLHHLDKADFAPRLGAAWVPFGHGKTVIRGGFGILYGEMFMNLTAFNRGNPPFSRGVTLFDQPFGTNILSGPAVTPPAFTYDPELKRPYYAEWNFGVQQKIDPNTSLKVFYVANRGKRLFRPFTPNFGNSFPGARPNPNFGRIVQWRSVARSWYDSMQVEVNRRFASGLAFQMSYTWSKSLDDASGEIFAFTENNFLSNPANPNVDKGPSDYDLTHILVGNWVYELPFGKGKRFLGTLNPVGNVLLGGWRVSGIFTYHSGQRVTFFSGIDNNGDGNLNDRARVMGNLGVLKQTSGLDKTQFFSPAAVGTALSATTGTIIGRNTHRGPSFYNTDLGFTKRFDLTERYKLDFRWESFNLFNHPNLEQPVSNVSAPTFGRIFALRNLGREMQFGLKLRF